MNGRAAPKLAFAFEVRVRMDAFEWGLEDFEECRDPFTIAAGVPVAKPLAGQRIRSFRFRFSGALPF
jgi:hypothetical protein